MRFSVFGVRPWLRWTAIAAVAVIVVSLVCVWQLNRQTSVEFDRVAAMKYEEALAQIEKQSKTPISGVFDGKRVVAKTIALQPGKGIGINPRFRNIGKTPAAIYRGPDGEWFILGKLEVLDYVNGRWRVNRTVENQKFRYQPPE